MRVAILDLLYDRVPHRSVDPYGAYFRKQFTGIMPQTVAVWCRQLGHKVHYTTYWGQADPVSLLPNDIDVLFVSSYTQSSALAYAIATVFKRRNTLTVLGGPHARSFPTDSMRFFDIVVKDCDRPLIADILNKRFDPPLSCRAPGLYRISRPSRNASRKSESLRFTGADPRLRVPSRCWPASGALTTATSALTGTRPTSLFQPIGCTPISRSCHVTIRPC